MICWIHKLALAAQLYNVYGLGAFCNTPTLLWPSGSDPRSRGFSGLARVLHNPSHNIISRIERRRAADHNTSIVTTLRSPYSPPLSLNLPPSYSFSPLRLTSTLFPILPPPRLHPIYLILSIPFFYSAQLSITSRIRGNRA